MLCFNQILREPSKDNCWVILLEAGIHDARVGDEKVSGFDVGWTQ